MESPAHNPDQVLLDFAQAAPGKKRLRSLQSFQQLQEQLKRHGVHTDDWCSKVVAELRKLAAEFWGKEWEEICAARISGGSNEGSEASLKDASAAMKKGIAKGIAWLSKGQEARRELLQTVASEYLQGREQGFSTRHVPAAAVTVRFRSRPLGMTPAKGQREGDDPVTYVASVDYNDPSKPAAWLGVKPGWIVTKVGGVDVQQMRLSQIQSLLKELPLPLSVQFEKRAKDALELAGIKKEADTDSAGYPATAPAEAMCMSPGGKSCQERSNATSECESTGGPSSCSEPEARASQSVAMNCVCDDGACSWSDDEW